MNDNFDQEIRQMLHGRAERAQGDPEVPAELAGRVRRQRAMKMIGASVVSVRFVAVGVASAAELTDSTGKRTEVAAPSTTAAPSGWRCRAYMAGAAHIGCEIAPFYGVEKVRDGVWSFNDLRPGYGTRGYALLKNGGVAVVSCQPEEDIEENRAASSAALNEYLARNGTNEIYNP